MHRAIPYIGVFFAGWTLGVSAMNMACAQTIEPRPNDPYNFGRTWLRETPEQHYAPQCWVGPCYSTVAPPVLIVPSVRPPNLHEHYNNWLVIPTNPPQEDDGD